MHKVFHVIMIIEQVKRKNLLNKKIPSVSEMEVAQRYKLFTLYTLLTLPGWQKLCGARMAFAEKFGVGRKF